MRVVSPSTSRSVSCSVSVKSFAWAGSWRFDQGDALQEFDIALHGRQRGAQFMADIGDQALLRAEQTLDAVEHFVKGGGQFAHFAGRVGDIKTAFQVFGACNAARRLGDRVDRRQGAATQESADNGRQNQTECCTEHQVAAHLLQCLIHLAGGTNELDSAHNLVVYEDRHAVDSRP